MGHRKVRELNRELHRKERELNKLVNRELRRKVLSGSIVVRDALREEKYRLKESNAVLERYRMRFVDTWSHYDTLTEKAIPYMRQSLINGKVSNRVLYKATLGFRNLMRFIKFQY